jgi:hypothetical protein
MPALRSDGTDNMPCVSIDSDGMCVLDDPNVPTQNLDGMSKFLSVVDFIPVVGTVSSAMGLVVDFERGDGKSMWTDAFGLIPGDKIVAYVVGTSLTIQADMPSTANTTPAPAPAPIKYGPYVPRNNLGFVIKTQSTAPNWLQLMTPTPTR